MIILAIDPGVELCACAWFDDACLRRIEFHAAHKVRGACSRIPDLVVVERPEYQGARSDAARTQDLLALSWAGAKAAYRVGAPEVREVTPSEWKGSEAKPPQHARMWTMCLTDDEKKLFPADTGKRIMTAARKYALHPGRPGAEYYGRGKGSEVHNLLDAAALGLAYVGRFR